MVTSVQVLEALRQVFDPELPVNIVDLGLVYDVQVEEAGVVHVTMTLTHPGCGMGAFIAADARARVEEVDGVTEAQVHVTFEPPWEPSRMSDEAARLLGGLD